MSDKIAPPITMCSSRTRRVEPRAEGPDCSAVRITSVDICYASFPGGGALCLDHMPMERQTVRRPAAMARESTGYALQCGSGHASIGVATKSILTSVILRV